MLYSLGALFASLMVLLLSGWFLTLGAITVAAKMKISKFTTGVIVLGIGTSLPELFLGIISAWQGVPQVALGNAVGSNSANIGMVLAVAMLLKHHLRFNKQDIAEQLPLMLAVTFFFGYLIFDLKLSRIESSFLLVAAIGYIGYMLKRPPEVKEEIKEPTGFIKALSYIIGALIALPIAAHFTIEHAVELAEALKVPPVIIGLSATAIGTSLPELAVIITAAWRKEVDFITGNIIGSNIFNLTLIAGVTGLIAPIYISKLFLYRDLVVCIILSVLLFVLVKFKTSKKSKTVELGIFSGIFFVLSYIGYLFLLTQSA